MRLFTSELVKKYKSRTVVNHVTIDVKQGEIVGLLGPNGARKTTTLRMIATLIKPDAGDALLDGASVVKEPELVRRKIGFLTSELKLEEFFTPDYLFDFFSEVHGVPHDVRTERKKDLFTRYLESVLEYQTLSEMMLFQNSFKLGARLAIEVMME